MMAAEVFTILGAALLFIAGVGLLALSARWWADAVAAVYRARSHGAELEERQRIYEQAHDAVDEAQERARRARADVDNPTDDELREAVLLERQRNEQRDYDTLANEGIEMQEPIPSGSFYNVVNNGLH